MLSLAFALLAGLQGHPVQSPAVVRAYHGSRLELVFTAPLVVTAKRAAPACETFGPRPWDDSYVTVCGGHVVEVTTCKPDAAISSARERASNALRAKLSAGDDGGKVVL